MAEILEHIYAKTPSISLASSCPRVLSDFLNISIINRFKSIVRRGGTAKATATIAMSQYSDGSAMKRFWSSQTTDVPRSLFAFPQAMRDWEDPICRRIAGNINDVCILYRYLCRQIIRKSDVLPYHELPKRLRKRVTTEQHASIVFDLLQRIEEYAKESN